jgi:hypothetical protein
VEILYRLIVLYFVVHIVAAVVRERKFWSQVGAAVVLVLFALRLFLIK